MTDTATATEQLPVQAPPAAPDDDTEAPPPTALERELISALADLVRANEQLTKQLADAHRALALVVDRLSDQPDPGDVVDRAQRYTADLDAQAAIARVHERMRELTATGPTRHLHFTEISALLGTHHNAPAGSPK